MTESHVTTTSALFLLALTVSAVFVFAGCTTSSTGNPAGTSGGEADESGNESANVTVSDDLFIENDSEADIGEMI